MDDQFIPLGFEDVNIVIEGVDLSQFDDPKKVGAAAISPDQLGSIYKTVRPILVLLTQTWFLPAKWKAALTVFISYADAFTGTVPA